MKRHMVALALAASCVACGERARQLQENAEMAQAVAGSAEEMQQSVDEAERFLAERKASGDTIAMPYQDLQGYLPESIPGYAAEGDPTGSTMNMGGLSVSSAERRYVSGADAGQQRIHVTITDYSGSESGYVMMAPLLAMNFSMEDDQRRVRTAQLDIPYTNGIEEFEKSTRDVKATVGTRYRYYIVVEATDQKDDASAIVVGIAADIARKLAGK